MSVQLWRVAVPGAVDNIYFTAYINQHSLCYRQFESLLQRWSLRQAVGSNETHRQKGGEKQDGRFQQVVPDRRLKCNYSAFMASPVSILITNFERFKPRKALSSGGNEQMGSS